MGTFYVGQKVVVAEGLVSVVLGPPGTVHTVVAVDYQFERLRVDDGSLVWRKMELFTHKEEGQESPADDAVDHPSHYGGADNPYEVIKVIQAWGLGFCLGNAVKYVARAGKKDPAKHLEDLRKARWYLDEEIRTLSKGES